MTTPENFAQATLHLEQAREAIDHLADIYEAGVGDDKRVVASLYDQVRQHTKLAEVEALLAIARQLDLIGNSIEWLGIGQMPGVKGRPLAPEALEAGQDCGTRDQAEGLICTRLPEHAGDHIAHDIQGNEVGRWSA